MGIPLCLSSLLHQSGEHKAIKSTARASSLGQRLETRENDSGSARNPILDPRMVVEKLDKASWCCCFAAGSRVSVCSVMKNPTKE